MRVDANCDQYSTREFVGQSFIHQPAWFSPIISPIAMMTKTIFVWKCVEEVGLMIWPCWSCLHKVMCVCVRSAVKGGGVGKEGGHLNRDSAFGKKKRETQQPPVCVWCGGEERLCGRAASSDDFFTSFTCFPSAHLNVGKSFLFRLQFPSGEA